MSHAPTFVVSIDNISQVPAPTTGDGTAPSAAVLYVNPRGKETFLNDVRVSVTLSDNSPIPLKKNHWFTLDFTNFLSGPSDLDGATMDEMTGWQSMVQGQAILINYEGPAQSVSSVSFTLRHIPVTADRADADGQSLQVTPRKFDVTTAQPCRLAVMPVPSAEKRDPELNVIWDPIDGNEVLAGAKHPGVNPPLRLLIENLGPALPADTAVSLRFDEGDGPAALVTHEAVSSLTITPATENAYNQTWKETPSGSHTFRTTRNELLAAGDQPARDGSPQSKVVLELNNIKTTPGPGTPNLYVAVTFGSNTGFNDVIYRLPIRKVDNRVYIEGVTALTADGRDALAPGVRLNHGETVSLQWYTRGASYSVLRGDKQFEVKRLINDGRGQANRIDGIQPGPEDEYTVLAYRCAGYTGPGGACDAADAVAQVPSQALRFLFNVPAIDAFEASPYGAQQLELSWTVSNAVALQLTAQTSADSDPQAFTPAIGAASHTLDWPLRDTTYTLSVYDSADFSADPVARRSIPVLARPRVQLTADAPSSPKGGSAITVRWTADCAQQLALTLLHDGNEVATQRFQVASADCEQPWVGSAVVQLPSTGRAAIQATAQRDGMQSSAQLTYAVQPRPAIAIGSGVVNSGNPEMNPCHFEFSANITSWIVGLHHLKLRHGDSDQKVRQIQVEMTPYVNPRNGRQLIIPWQAVMTEGDPAKLEVDLGITCMAILAEPADAYSTVDLESITEQAAQGAMDDTGLAPGYHNPNPTQAAESLPRSQQRAAFLSGFNLEFNSSHWVEKLYAGVSLPASDGDGEPIPVAHMRDASKNYAPTRYVSGGTITSLDIDHVQMAKFVQEGTRAEARFASPAPRAEFAIFLSYFDLAYAGATQDHWIRSISVGTGGAALKSNDDNTVLTFDDPIDQIKDDSSNVGGGAMNMFAVRINNTPVEARFVSFRTS